MIVERSWLFDIDGVLTNPEIGAITDPVIVSELVKRLKKGESIGFNTGRSLDFIISDVMVPLERQLGDRRLLHQVMASGEKGAVTLYYDEHGNRQTTVTAGIAVPANLQEQVAALVTEHYTQTMFFDTTKQTMISVEMKHGTPIATFKSAQKNFVNEAGRLLAHHTEGEKYFIDPSVAATDIQSISVGKQYGAQHFIDWLAVQNIVPQQYIAFGDSVSDLAMGEALGQSGVPFQFIFVGNRALVAGKKLAFEPLFSREPYNQGTLAYLRGLEV